MLTNDQMIDLLHRSGVRPSVHRIAVLGYIANNRTHPTADEIYSAVSSVFPTVSKTTVYNSLHTLVEARVLRVIEIDRTSTRYDLALQSPHSHFRCVNCGRIFDMALPTGIESLIRPGFKIESTDLYFTGHCPDCIA